MHGIFTLGYGPVRSELIKIDLNLGSELIEIDQKDLNFYFSLKLQIIILVVNRLVRMLLLYQ